MKRVASLSYAVIVYLLNDIFKGRDLMFLQKIWLNGSSNKILKCSGGSVLPCTARNAKRVMSALLALEMGGRGLVL